MAQPEINLKNLCCSICLDVLNDPVTIPCGHSYCMSCIKSHWDQEDQKRIHSCPQCRQHFIPNPVLVKNTILADLVEELKKTGLRAAPADHCYAGPEDVACDFCTGRKRKATKSCLQCLVSYCEEHLQPHYDSPAFEKHKLVQPSKKLQKSICSCHDELMKIFCRTDQLCICYLCSMDEHKGHDTVSAAAERAERQKELMLKQQTIQQRIQEREKDVKVLQQEVEAVNDSADKALRESERIFKEMIRLIEKMSLDTKQQIESQQQTEVSRIKEQQEKLGKELAELRQKHVQLEQLSHIEDHIQFLHNCSSLSNLTASSESSSIQIRPLRYFEEVTAAVSEVRDKLQDMLREEWIKISQTATKVDVLLPQAEARSKFLKCWHKISLEANTANTCLLLSEGNRKATVMSGELSYCSHPERFIDWFQVLGGGSLTGRCYWEVEWSGLQVSIAVTYKDISRAGDESLYGNNDKSWALTGSNKSYEFRHNSTSTAIPVSGPSRVGVYLDHRAGTLCFYSVSETMTLLHRVQTTFTQPLYAGLGLIGLGSTAEFYQLE